MAIIVYMPSDRKRDNIRFNPDNQVRITSAPMTVSEPTSAEVQSVSLIRPQKFSPTKADSVPENTQRQNNQINGHGQNLVLVFDTLKSEIMLRHYSPKTLKSYRGWVLRL